MKIRQVQQLRNPNVKYIIGGRRLTAGVLLPAVCALAVGACGKAETVDAASADTSTAASTTTTSVEQSTTSPLPTTTTTTEAAPPPPAATTTAPKPVPPTKQKKMSCSSFLVAAAANGNKKITARMTATFPNLKNVVTVVETAEWPEPVGSGRGLSATAVPSVYAADLVPGGQDENPHYTVTVLDYSNVPGGLPEPLPQTTLEAPDAAKAYKCS